MQENNNNSQPLGICHRLFNFILNSLIAPGLKRLTTGYPLPDQDLNESPAEVSSTKYSKLSLKPAVHNGEKSMLLTDFESSRDYSSSEIMVEFRHANGVEQWAHARDFGSLDRVPKKDSPLVIRDHTKLQKGMENRNSIKVNFQEKEKIEKKDAKIPVDQKLKGVVELEDNKPLRRPILLTNINEKSDEFIRQKREALRRTNSNLEQS